MSITAKLQNTTGRGYCPCCGQTVRTAICDTFEDWGHEYFHCAVCWDEEARYLNEDRALITWADMMDGKVHFTIGANDPMWAKLQAKNPSFCAIVEEMAAKAEQAEWSEVLTRRAA